MIATIWKEFFELWEQRNNLVHGTDMSSQDLANSSKAIAQIKNTSTLNKTRSLQPTNPACLCAIQELDWTVI
jgi:hypothetical protein